MSKYLQLVRDLLFNESAAKINYLDNAAAEYSVRSRIAEGYVTQLLALILEDNGKCQNEKGTENAIEKAKAKMRTLQGVRASYNARAIRG